MATEAQGGVIEVLAGPPAGQHSTGGVVEGLAGPPRGMHSTGGVIEVLTVDLPDAIEAQGGVVEGLAGPPRGMHSTGGLIEVLAIRIPDSIAAQGGVVEGLAGPPRGMHSTGGVIEVLTAVIPDSIEAQGGVVEGLAGPPRGMHSTGGLIEVLTAVIPDTTKAQGGVIEGLAGPPRGMHSTGGLIEVLAIRIPDSIGSLGGVVEGLAGPPRGMHSTGGVIEALVASFPPTTFTRARGGVVEGLAGPPRGMHATGGVIEALVVPPPFPTYGRKLVDLIVQLDLEPERIAQRTGQDVPDLVTSPAGAIDWQTHRETRRTDALGGWAGIDTTWAARATLAGTVSDTDYDVATNGPRRVETPALVAAGLRAFQAIELHAAIPAGSSVLYRLRTGGVERYVSGSNWLPATDDLAHWSTADKIVHEFPRLSPAGRDLTVIAWLQSSDGAAPSFFGASVAYSVRDRGDEDDALIRTLRVSLRDEIEATAVARLQTAAGSGAGPFELGGGEFEYDVSDVVAVFNLTDDPDELIELPGTFTAGTPATWTPDTAIADDKVISLEFCYRPAIVVARHRDLVKIEATPTVLIMFSGAAPSTTRSALIESVRNFLTVSPPAVVGLPAPTLVTQSLDVSVIGELGSDVRRLEGELRDWLQGRGYRVLSSPETGRPVSVREVAAWRSTTTQLSQGMHEARATWLISYLVRGAKRLEPIHFVRTGGVLTDLTGE